ncbi:shikimate kinase [Desulfogranum mediterraneum]|uniref:shikimate kinase n=1 Tax=Desulfogranum mediterraneum TaxID=160661 RepID=UPI00054D2CF1|nr:shikimate kinase [Desulfogranum mediterraneum]
MEKKQTSILLTGFRATGKSVVGALLAERLGFQLVDSDQEICRRRGMTVAEIVAQSGWEGFRRAEQELLLELCDAERVVLAVGGGAIEHQELWPQLRQSYWVVWLRADVATIVQRMGDDHASSGQRPSLTGLGRAEEVAALLTRRTPLYRDGSDLALDTDQSRPAQLVEEIIARLGLQLTV